MKNIQLCAGKAVRYLHQNPPNHPNFYQPINNTNIKSINMNFCVLIIQYLDNKITKFQLN